MTDEADPDAMQLASSSLMPVAEEVKPPPPIPPSRKSSTDLAPIPPRPPSSADIVTSAPAIPAAAPTRPRSVAPEAFTPATPPTRPRSIAPEPVTAPSPSAPSMASVELSEAAQEQLAAIVHTVIESTLAPAIAKQKELEARLEALQKASAVRVPAAASLSPVRSLSPSVADLSGSTPPRPAMVSTSYGLVSVMPGPAPRPAIEEALERLGPIDVPDFAGKRKFAGGIVIAVLIVGVVGAILATILSYS